MDNPLQQTFFSMLAEYHTQIHPFPYLGSMLGLMVIVLFLSPYPHKSRVSLLTLAFLWAWNGLVMFTYHFAELYPVNYALQGVLFPIQALLLSHAAFMKAPPEFDVASGVSGKAGLALMFTALFLYPIIGNITGHYYPAAPVFPDPCCLTIFTFGYLLSARARMPSGLIVIPFLWSLMGIVAVMKLGVMADGLMVVVGIGCSVAILLKNRTASRLQTA